MPDAVAAPSGVYKPRRPQASPLFRLVSDHLHRLQTVYDERLAREYGPWRSVVVIWLQRLTLWSLLQTRSAPEFCQHRMWMVLWADDSLQLTRRMTAPVAKPRKLSKVVATKPGCAPLKLGYELAVAAIPKTWDSVEPIFLRAMEGFDTNVASGLSDIGDLQNGKGDFFNDILALLLENCAGVELWSRGGVPGLIIPKHNLDVTYPNDGPIEFVLEAKAVGTPQHPLSPKAKAIGRAGASDLDKRVKEIAFKTIDLKAEYARHAATRGESTEPMSGDLTTWLRSVKPRTYVFLSARVVSDADLRRVIQFAELASQVSDACGLYCFRPVSALKPTTYVAESVPSHVNMARVLFRACQDLQRIRVAREKADALP